MLICADFGFSELAKSLALKKERRCDYVSEREESGLGLPVFRMQQYKSSRKPGLYGWIKQASGTWSIVVIQLFESGWNNACQIMHIRRILHTCCAQKGMFGESERNHPVEINEIVKKL